ncbi:MAG: ABC transporter ATP-binding protein [Owenweeksia sp.]|nr:ABC transporter ATP-binding protein [Owenweeksia sp.]
MTSVEKLIVALETIYDVLTALEKVGEVTDLELELEEGTIITQTEPAERLSVDVQRLSFSYPGTEREVLRNITLQLEAGQHTFIFGSNESGKSTLLYLLAGLYEPRQGTLLTTVTPGASLNLGALRSNIGDCFGHEQLFQGTVLENISMGRNRATLANVQWAVKHLGLENFIRGLPQGYHTSIDPEGIKLPKSAVKKLLLARSIADLPRLLLLKDALQHLETEEGLKIMQFLTNPDRPWTLVLVSANPHLARLCKQVILMDAGQISHRGSYEEDANTIKPKSSREMLIYHPIVLVKK